MRIFKFWNEKGDEKEKESNEFEEATMSVQGDFKESTIAVEYISKKGKKMCHNINIPIVEKLEEAAILEKKRLAIKAAREAKEKSRYAANS